LFLSCIIIVTFRLRFVFVCLEADLEHSVAEGVAVEGLDGNQALVVVGHGHEAEALALVRLQVANHLHVLKIKRERCFVFVSNN
jgi:hypothetical protein